jgi:hypothetical protein
MASLFPDLIYVIFAESPTRYLRLSCLCPQEIHDLLSLPQQGFDVSLTQKQLQEEHGQQVDM